MFFYYNFNWIQILRISYTLNFRAIFDAESLMPDLQYNFTHDISQDQDQNTQDQDQDTQDQDQDTQDQEQDTQDQDQDTQNQKQDTQDQKQDTQDQDQDTQDQEQDTQDQDQDKKVQVAPADDYLGLRRNRNEWHKDEQDEIWQTLTGSSKHSSLAGFL